MGPVIDDVRMTRPCLEAISDGRHACTANTLPLTLTSSTSPSSSAVIVASGASGKIPALAHSTSIPPNASATAVAIAVHEAGSSTSVATPITPAGADTVQSGHGRVDIGRRPCGHRDIRTRFGEHRGDSAADTLAAAGDHDGPACEREHSTQCSSVSCHAAHWAIVIVRPVAGLPGRREDW